MCSLNKRRIFSKKKICLRYLIYSTFGNEISQAIYFAIKAFKIVENI